MEDCCAVCVEPLEWVAYGPCGHREVCSVCIARLRFVLGDKQCCICKQECPSVFVTKALGDYTKSVESFEDLAGRRDLWYENNVQAYFDDEEQCKIVKSMCRLSCSVCEAAESPGKDYVKKGHVFRNLDQLRRHLFNVHKVQMCGLCLEGRKVFICEQKLYSKKQLDRHLQSGNSEIDLNDEDRGWFNGHPLCNFCHTRFYGDNELYQHMSTEHFTCHICQRSHPGQYEYFRNYDDLEAHFRHDHALCEDPDCLAKKFVVFASDAELKRHNAMAHGGNMSRAQRNAALQIPVSFQYRRGVQDLRGARPFRRRDGHSSNLQSSGGLHRDNESPDVDYPLNGSSIQVDSTADFPHIQNLEGASLLSTLTEASPSTTTEPSRYRTAVSGVGPSSLRESAFPPLPGAETSQKSKKSVRGSPLSMASVLGGGERQRHHDQLTPASRDVPRNATSQAESLSQWPQASVSQKPQNGASSREMPRTATPQPESSSHWPQFSGNQRASNEALSRELVRNLTSQKDALDQWPQVSSHQGPQNDAYKAKHVPVLIRGNAERSGEDLQRNVGETTGSSDSLSGEELRAANRALRELIQSALQGDEERYKNFKLISAQFRSGDMEVDAYLNHVRGFGLLHVVPELARLCPDPKRKDDLLEAFHRGDLVNNQADGFRDPFPTLGQSSRDERSKNRHVAGGIAGIKLSDGDAGYSDSNEVEVLSKDGYRDSKGKKSYASAANEAQVQPVKTLVKARDSSDVRSSILTETSMSGPVDDTLPCQLCALQMREGSTHCAACGMSFSSYMKKVGLSQGEVSEKKKKKKVAKARMGDGSAAALLLEPKKKAWAIDEDVAPNASSAVTSSKAWGNGDGQRLTSVSHRGTFK